MAAKTFSCRDIILTNEDGKRFAIELYGTTAAGLRVVHVEGDRMTRETADIELDVTLKLTVRGTFVKGPGNELRPATCRPSRRTSRTWNTSAPPASSCLYGLRGSSRHPTARRWRRTRCWGRGHEQVHAGAVLCRGRRFLFGP